MKLKKYSRTQIIDFLRAVDRNLKDPFSVILIGGAAASVAYGVENVTRDIDTMNDISPLLEACRAAERETGLNVPFGPAGVADAPYEYEGRLQECKIPGMKKLNVLVPEVHDLILMKVVRGYEHDLETILEISKHAQVKQEILVDRFRKEMAHVTGDPQRLRLNFLAATERIFGSKVAEEAAEELSKK